MTEQPARVRHPTSVDGHACDSRNDHGHSCPDQHTNTHTTHQPDDDQPPPPRHTLTRRTPQNTRPTGQTNRADQAPWSPTPKPTATAATTRRINTSTRKPRPFSRNYETPDHHHRADPAKPPPPPQPETTNPPAGFSTNTQTRRRAINPPHHTNAPPHICRTTAAWSAPPASRAPADPIVGKGNRSAIGTLVDRSTRYVERLHPPGGRGAEQVRDALVHALGDLPAEPARSVTRDQGSETSRHDEFTRSTGVPVHFCEPAGPWQRGSKENTNGPLRRYFPKSTDLSLLGAGDLAFVAAELDSRPRKTLGWNTPANLFAKLVATLE
ncbi:IS30 family transposase [Embleya sp. NPDC059259]|uniref:IS30 family transposase n=1 Tax=unclassified Embleya TaxID=2699296 RepID=UPI0036C93682